MVATHYVKSRDAYIAYQVIGDGPHTLIFVPGFVSNLEYMWEEPNFNRQLIRLGSFCRLICFDKVGTGLSDRNHSVQTLEDRIEDVLAVMNAVGVDRTVLLGFSEGSPMSVLFAATHPQRISALVLYGSFAKGSHSEDYPWALKPYQFENWIENIPNIWTNPGIDLDYWAPSMANDERFRLWWQKFIHLSASPGAAMELIRMYQQIDVRAILPTIQVPTLVLHRKHDRATLVEGGRYLAQRIPNAKYVELAGQDHMWWTDKEGDIVAEIEEFLTGVRSIMDIDRVLATVLFTDIVNSTIRAVTLGDAQWSRLLENHHHLIRREIDRFRGREVKTTGDGFLVLFDGPSRAIRCAAAIQEAVNTLGVEVRAGLHTGECVIGGEDISGVAVHIAARVLGQAKANEIVVSSTVKDLVVGSGIQFEDRGLHQLKGVDGEWRLFVVANNDK
ncbi:MAG: adenylate/guanylate cyclase domain-containing protein [Anaerolineales bacterium]|nr:adenylate/guanylate cyclase domain-containing protein [Anaerolineales bacterium]